MPLVSRWPARFCLAVHMWPSPENGNHGTEAMPGTACSLGVYSGVKHLPAGSAKGWLFSLFTFCRRFILSLILYGLTRALAPMNRSEDSSGVGSLSTTCPRDGTQVLRLGCRCLLSAEPSRWALLLYFILRQGLADFSRLPWNFSLLGVYAACVCMRRCARPCTHGGHRVSLVAALSL